MSQALPAAVFDTFATLLKSRSGLVIGTDKLYLLETRLASILKREQLSDLTALAGRLRLPGNDALVRQVVEAMTTNESFFFRDDKPFQHFRTLALPRLLAARPTGGPLRVWSAASSSGQEAYSVAMILSECRQSIGARKIEIIGTDLARDQVTRARDGLYTQFEVQRGLPVQMLMRHFQKEEGGWRISEAIRGMVQFREWNLLADLRPLGRFDVVFCRNVLIYFDQPTKARVLDAVAQQMPGDGLLYLGGAETVLGITGRFAPLAAERGVYGLAASPAAPQGFASEQGKIHRRDAEHAEKILDTSQDFALTRCVIGLAIEVHSCLGPGLLESAYEECLCIELERSGIAFGRQVPLPITYKGTCLDLSYRMDAAIGDQLIVEIKAVEKYCQSIRPSF